MTTPGIRPSPTGHPADLFHRLRTDPRARDLLQARSAIVHAIRRRLDRDGHTHVDTPLLQRRSPGAGQGFSVGTRYLGPEVVLRASPLYLRAMLTTGFARVYEIGRVFRDEPADTTHAPEYTLVEIYQAHADYVSTRRLVEGLVRAAADAMPTVAPAPEGATRRIDWEAPWAIVTVHAAVGAAVGADIDSDTAPGELLRLARAHGLDPNPANSGDELLLHLYDHLVEPATVAPTFHIDFPASQAPLAQPCPHDRRLVQKWDLVAGGVEIATSYTELADGAALRARLRPHGPGAGCDEAATMSDAWLDVFDAGMPPAGGLCVGLDRLVQVLADADHIEDVVPFPLPAPTRTTR